MKYSESETTEINYNSESEGTGIRYKSETEGTGINKSPIKLLFLLLTLVLSNNVFSNEIHIFQTNKNQVKGVLLINKISYFIEGELENDVLSAQILQNFNSTKSTDEGTGKSTDEGTGDESTDEGTGDESTDEGTGKSTDEGTGKYVNQNISVILQCGVSEGIIESKDSKSIEIFEGKVKLNGYRIKCNVNK